MTADDGIDDGGDDGGVENGDRGQNVVHMRKSGGRRCDRGAWRQVKCSVVAEMKN